MRTLLLVVAFAASSALGHGNEPHKPAAGHDHTSAGETAFGRPGDPAKVDRTINIERLDIDQLSRACGA